MRPGQSARSVDAARKAVPYPGIAITICCAAPDEAIWAFFKSRYTLSVRTLPGGIGPSMCVFEPAARYTAATLMLNLDISRGWPPARLGQATVAMPLDRSSRVFDSLRGEATRTVRGLLEGRCATDTGVK